jgi:integrase
MYTSKTKNVLALGPVKTDESEGYIPLSENIIRVLKKKRKIASKKYTLEYGAAYKSFDFIWCRDFGSPFDPNYLYNQFTKMLADNNLRKIRFHDLHHTHATLLLQS